VYSAGKERKKSPQTQRKKGLQSKKRKMWGSIKKVHSCRKRKTLWGKNEHKFGEGGVTPGVEERWGVGDREI